MFSFLSARNRALFAYMRDKWQDMSASEEEVANETKAVEARFHEKLANVAGRLAQSVLEDIVTAYIVLRDPDTPVAAKAALAAALIYFISPFDAVSDFLPLGLVDDTAILGAALSHVSKYIKPRHREEASDMLDTFLRNLRKAGESVG